MLKCRWLSGLAIPVAIMVLICLAPLASASDTITVFGVDTEDRTIVAGNSETFEWVVYNNGTSPTIVEPELYPSSLSWSDISMDPYYAVIEPGDSQSFVLTMSVYRSTGSMDVELAIFFNHTLMDDPSYVSSVEDDLSITIESLYGTAAGNNKIFGIWDNPLPSPLDTTYGAFLFTMIGWVIIAVLLSFGIAPVVHMFTDKTKTDLDDSLLGIIKAPVSLLVVLYGLVNSLRILNIPSDLQLIIEDAYSVILIVLLTWLGYMIYDSIFMTYVRRHSKKRDNEAIEALLPLMEKLGMIIIPFIGLMFIFNLFNYDITIFLASLGILSIVVGLAAQDTLSNFFSGTSLILDRPFKVGDLILIEGDICEVTRIGLRSTTLYNTFQEQHLIIPNSIIANNKITNIVKPDLRYKVKIEIGVAYGSEVELVKKLMMDAALEHGDVMNDSVHYPWVRFTEFGESALSFKLFIWVDDLNDQWKVASDVRESIDAKFRENGIEIPFPQRDVWFKNRE